MVALVRIKEPGRFFPRYAGKAALENKSCDPRSGGPEGEEDEKGGDGGGEPVEPPLNVQEG